MRQTIKPANLSGIPYNDSQLTALHLYEYCTPQPKARFLVQDTAKITILARLVFLKDSVEKFDIRDAYDLKFYVPICNLETGKTDLVDFLVLGDILNVRTNEEFIAKNPLINLQIQGPRNLPLLVNPKQGSNDHAILDAVCEDEEVIRQNFGKLLKGGENALFNLHARFLTTRISLSNWNADPVAGSCETNISSELNEEYTIQSSCIRSPNTDVDKTLRRIYSRSPSAPLSPTEFSSSENFSSTSAGFSAQSTGDSSSSGPIIVAKPPGY